MRRFLWADQGFQEKEAWQADCWINVEAPTPADIKYLIEKLNVPESFCRISKMPMSVPV